MPPITYQMMQDAYLRASSGTAQPQQIVITKQMQKYLDSLLYSRLVPELHEHIPGVECVDNPFCEECYK